MDLKDPVLVLAATCYGEARGSGMNGMRDVASVVLNRVAHPRWWGNDIISVCLDPWQFSSWNENDPNRAKLIALDYNTIDQSFYVARIVAREAINKENIDRTGGADSYFALTIPRPSWTARARHTCDRYGQSFWRVELPAPETVTPDNKAGDPAAPTIRIPTEDNADRLDDLYNPTA